MKIGFVVGEHSADLIGADLIRSLRARIGNVQPVGLGGPAMEAEGLSSLFDIEELSIIGVGAIVARLPQLVRRLSQTVDGILAEHPDIVVTIDSFTFTNRVAARIRRARPELPILNIVPPAIWAYRPERAKALAAAVDRTICLFPFEPDYLKAAGGPPATYVGHPIMSDPHLNAIWQRRAELPKQLGVPPLLMILPGSRRGEVSRLMDDFGRTVAQLATRMPELRFVLPVVPRVEHLVRDKLKAWTVQPQLVTGEAGKWQAFEEADAALAASGTVALELALASVPTVITYRLDPVSYQLRGLISGWTASLPNYILDHPLLSEHFHEFVRPDLLSRRLQRLLSDTPERAAQLEGFAEVRRRMTVSQSPGEASAQIVLEMVGADAQLSGPSHVEP
ncbi:lipid-A-disaccharide synthase [Aureimonas frigidaquae]|uniref:Lipid-A-disaccharide synthase n=1 Tax=Aureimonas frigidaquae TaxID=424757 RepID=A0A0P0Z2U1_9HYPH|nr:lipid-A-disaccharide synthase [Aureimonas frigidaquae]BAT28406.1 putative lipid A disaccharide synthase [Aureimonas frigidaquae]